MFPQKFEPNKFQELIVHLIAAIIQENENDIKIFLSFHTNFLYQASLFGNTLLHLALKNKKLVSFRVLVEELKRHDLDRLVLAVRDRRGGTVLHVAVANKMVEAVRVLCADTSTKMPVNLKNERGETPLDVYYGLEFDSFVQEIEFDSFVQEIEDILLEVGAEKGNMTKT